MTRDSLGLTCRLFQKASRALMVNVREGRGLNGSESVTEEGVMQVFEEWPHRWFGFWSEGEATEQALPEKEDFVDPAWECPQRLKVLYYLRHSPILMFNPYQTFRTDGDWLWMDTVAEEMEHEHLRLPDSLVAHITERGFEPLPYLETSLQMLHDTLDWPGRPLVPILKVVNTDPQRARAVRRLYSTLKHRKRDRPLGNFCE